MASDASVLPFETQRVRAYDSGFHHILRDLAPLLQEIFYNQPELHDEIVEALHTDNLQYCYEIANLSLLYEVGTPDYSNMDLDLYQNLLDLAQRPPLRKPRVIKKKKPETVSDDDDTTIIETKGKFSYSISPYIIHEISKNEVFSSNMRLVFENLTDKESPDYITIYRGAQALIWYMAIKIREQITILALGRLKENTVSNDDLILLIITQCFLVRYYFSLLVNQTRYAIFGQEKGFKRFVELLESDTTIFTTQEITDISSYLIELGEMVCLNMDNRKSKKGNLSSSDSPDLSES